MDEDTDALEAANAQQELEECQQLEEAHGLLQADPYYDQWLEYVASVLDATVGRAVPVKVNSGASSTHVLSRSVLDAERALKRAQEAYNRALARYIKAGRKAVEPFQAQEVLG